MSGKSVYSIWLQKYGKEQADRRYAEWKQKMNNRYSRFSQQEKQIFKQKSKRIGQKNGMYGKTPYDVWLQKYGKEEADRRYIEWRQRITKSSKRGKESHNYGKTPPVGSGNGWGGWYNGWYFRSIKELTYMICVIQKNGYEWESAENKKFAIE